MLESLVLILFIIAAYTYGKTRRLNREIDKLQAENRHLDQLTARVWALEQKLAQPPPPGVAAAPVEAPVTTTLPEPAVAEPEPEPQPAKRLFAPPPVPAEPPVPSWRERVSTGMGSQEWEAVVGGSWLNKLGVLVLIVGIALLLGYSFTKVGPAGRVAIALAVSASMLIAGVAVERRSLYRVFARGLIGGGWAGIYFTTYAMYAVDAARILTSPWLASILLTAVAAGMIAHSLKYRSQTVTGLAYFIAFATLVLTPVTSFSFIALVPLVASLLYLAHRFEWFDMALFGVFATYGTCIARGDAGSPLASSQSIIGIYWLLFEIFTLLRASRPGPFKLPEQWIFPLNTIGLFALSLPKWFAVARHDAWLFLAVCALINVAGSAARFRLRPSDEKTPLGARIANAGYEGPATIAAGLVVAAIWLKLTTIWINFGFLVEAEILFIAGLWLRQAYLQRLGAVVFGIATLKLLAQDAPKDTAGGGRLLALQRAHVRQPILAADRSILQLRSRYSAPAHSRIPGPARVGGSRLVCARPRAVRVRIAEIVDRVPAAVVRVRCGRDGSP